MAGKYEGVQIIVRRPCANCQGSGAGFRVRGYAQADAPGEWSVVTTCEACDGRGYYEADLLHKGEPFFLVRGQDALAGHVVAAYALLLGVAWPGDRSVDDLHRQREDLARVQAQIHEWQQANPGLVDVAD